MEANGSVLVVLRLANGRLERLNNRGLWRQTAGCNALTTEGYGGKRQADRSCREALRHLKPAVVPGAASALAKAGVGGFELVVS